MHFQKKDKVYISIILALILILSFTSYQWYTYATNGAISSPIWEAGTQVETASYVIFKEGSTYYAKNGTTGEIEFSGTDMTTVFQSAIAVLSHGRIVIKAGEYELSSSISLQNKPIILEGEGWGYDETTGSYTGTILKCSGDVLKLNNTDPMYGQTIKNILINGVDKTGDGLFITKAYEFLIEHVGIINCNNSVHIKGPVSWHVSMFKEIWERNCHYGFLIEHGDNHEAVNNMVIVGGRIWGDTVAIYIKGYCTKIRFHGTFISFDDTAIKLETIHTDAGDVLPNAITFTDCWIESSSENQTYVDMVKGTDTTKYPRTCEFIGNYFTGHGGTLNFNGDRHRIIANTVGGSGWTWNITLNGDDNVMESWAVFRTNVVLNYNISGSGNKVRNNYDFVTENSGTAEASNDDWISFGVTFAGTPQTVILTVQESDARYIAQVKAKNSTHFQLYLYDETAGALETVDKTISWYAEYKP